MSEVPAITLHTGHQMPALGFGTFLVPDSDVESAVDTALEVGYRHLDTARFYLNEAGVGRAVHRWLEEGKGTRDELFITTKLPPRGNRAESVESYLKQSLEDLQLDYVDLYLIHHPVSLKETDLPFTLDENGLVYLDCETDILSLWHAMEEQVYAGRVLHIGLSNFNASQMEKIMKVARIRPACNQIEANIYFQNKELIAFCRGMRIPVVAYAPLGNPGINIYLSIIQREKELVSLMEDPTILEIAEKYGKTPAQVAVRFQLQRGIGVLVKSVKIERQQENFQVFDFLLTQDEIKTLSNLDTGRRTFDGAELPGSESHPEFPYHDIY